MNVNEEIEDILRRMVEILRLVSRSDWAGALDSHRAEMRNNPDIAKSRVIAIYGGMGSLNDLVLYQEGKPLVKENIEFDDLRSRLYELCHKM